jgi:long-chain acyl-CoA synthetase
MSEKPWLARYDEGVPHHIDYPEVPLFYFLEEAARKYPDAPCTIFKGAKVSYREMKPAGGSPGGNGGEER